MELKNENMMIMQIERARMERRLLSILHYATQIMLLACLVGISYMIWTNDLPIFGGLTAVLGMIWGMLALQHTHVTKR